MYALYEWLKYGMTYVVSNYESFLPAVIGVVFLAAVIIIAVAIKYAITKMTELSRYYWRRAKHIAAQGYYHLRNRRQVRHISGKIMAKWKKGVVADIIFDALFEATCKGVLSDQEQKKACAVVGKALGLPDLLPRKVHKLAIKAWLKSKGKLDGPKKKMAAGGPPALYVPEPEKIVSNVKFLNKMREKKGKAA